MAFKFQSQRCSLSMAKHSMPPRPYQQPLEHPPTHRAHLTHVSQFLPDLLQRPTIHPLPRPLMRFANTIESSSETLVAPCFGWECWSLLRDGLFDSH